ncbi:C-5 cytosine-specific DNA methylase [Colletotrichum orchidophilum]|uniref:DNA (cytosine-5-)-methyltransferase n=1 Tax=Colletotrichum orchidophilum TaxID=1209926 RepID=A0A1G4BQ47_9PEZI|nr:C-5 cytosine-specific DNA methylase [Colletotrichum orchidophilum]OHF03445.1 C-5 cytosine-specific DNA methylase [Colletotrichum orchidophilum]
MATVECSGSSPSAAIVVDDDHTAEDQATADFQRRINAYQPQGGRNNSVITICSDFDVLEQEEEDLADKELKNLIDLTVDDYPIIHVRRRRRQAPRAKDPERRHENIKIGDLSIKLNRLYELDPAQCVKPALEPQFILVNSITENLAKHHFTIGGLPFVRARSLMAKLPRKLNEVAIVYELDETDDRTADDQASIEVPFSAIIGPRSLHMTNALYPHHRYDPKAFLDHEAVEKEGPLVCRWKYYIHYRDSKEKKAHRAHHWTLERVRADEVKREDFKVSEKDLRSDWRGVTIRGGAHIPEAQLQAHGQPPEKQQYTVFDSFCGAGGFSRGAERAGLKLQHAVDSWDRACNTYRRNFPATNLFEMTVDEFIVSQRDVAMRVDILHLSPPCQTWSPAHTVAGQNDEANIAALFACRSLVEKVRPRIFTLEQTFGIMQPVHAPFFCSLVGGFTEFGYSITWKIVHLQTWGLPQVRKRLIMIGSCPGEKLPPFPRATHSETGAGGLARYVTVRQALSKIRVTSSFHNPEDEVRDTLPLGSVVSNPDEILKRCVTCSGGQNMHWSNTRAYTVREFASLQGFPVWHQFAEAPKSALKKQIGNAFPACVVRLLYEHLKSWLLAEDGFAPPRDARRSVGGREVVFVTEAPAPRRVPTPVAAMLPSPLRNQGDSEDNAMMLDENDQIEIKFYGDSDVEMEDVPEAPKTPDTPDTPLSYFRSSTPRTMSLGPSPEPPQFGVRGSPIVID